MVVYTHHLALIFRIRCKKSQQVFRTLRDDRKNKTVRYSLLLRTIGFGYLFEIENANEMCFELRKFLCSLLDKTRPVITVKMSKDEPPYMTITLMALCKKKQILKRKERLHRIKTIELQIRQKMVNSASLKRKKQSLMNRWILSIRTVKKKSIKLLTCLQWTLKRILPVIAPILIPKDTITI